MLKSSGSSSRIARIDARGGGHDRVGRDAAGQPHVAADAAAVADHGVAAEDRRVGVDHDVVADRRVALGARHVLLDAQRAERDALVELDARAEHGGLADDDARAVVDRERRADPRGRMDVDAGVAVRDLGQHARHQRHLAALQLVREPVDGGGEEAGIGEDHLVDGVRGGVAVADRLGVEQQRFADVRQGGEEALDDIVGVRAVRLGQPQRVGQQRAAARRARRRRRRRGRPPRRRSAGTAAPARGG